MYRLKQLCLGFDLSSNLFHVMVIMTHCSNNIMLVYKNLWFAFKYTTKFYVKFTVYPQVQLFLPVITIHIFVKNSLSNLYLYLYHVIMIPADLSAAFGAW